MTSLDNTISRRLIFAITLTAITLVAEVIGGLWSNSLALLSDAGHVFLDLFALALSLAAIKLAAQPPNDIHSYGWHRAEVLASLINGLTVFLMVSMRGVRDCLHRKRCRRLRCWKLRYSA